MMSTTTTTTTSTPFPEPRFTRYVAAIDEQYSALLQELRRYIPRRCYDVEHMAALFQEQEEMEMLGRLWTGSEWQAALTEEGQRMAKEAEFLYKARPNDPASKGMSLSTRDHKQVGYGVPKEWDGLPGALQQASPLRAFKRHSISKAIFLKDCGQFTCSVGYCFVCGDSSEPQREAAV